MAKKNHHLLKRGDIWYVQAKVNGKRVRQALSQDVTEARTLRDELLEELTLGRANPARKERPVLGEVAKLWIRLEEKRLQPSTLRDYRGSMNYHVLPHFGGCFMHEIRPFDVEEFLAEMTCGAKRANNILVPLRSLFRFAKKNGFIERNVMLDVENLPLEKPQINPLSMEEVTAFLNSVNPHYRNFFIVAFFTGMRLGEQLALKWKAIDWKRRKINVVESRVMGTEGRPKTKGSYREIDMLPVVEEALREERRKVGLDSPYVFLNTEGNPIDGKTLAKRTWTGGLKRAGVEYRAMLHTRHTFATLMLSSGENQGWVQRMLGHTSLRMIQERYFKYIPNLTHADGSAFQEKFRNALEKVTPKLPQNKKGETTGLVISLSH